MATMGSTIDAAKLSEARPGLKMIYPQDEDKPKFKTRRIDDPCEYAPRLPKEDQWTIILKPLIEKDTAQCAIWKEEVGNLLIFAGLFSAVVTAFVIESYKSVQQDPNVVLIGLLHHIANRLDGPLNVNATSSPPLSPSPDSIVASFSQTPSSLRINVFWFLSLILSLTTVLIGTISLQWLREHQSYSDLSPKESLAVFRMRSEALEAWYVPQVFVILPLLLQGSLVLFFAGMIDFSLLLGQSIAIPVCIAIGATLLFLLTTTLLPTLQGFVVYFPLLSPRKALPTLCPYRSPQSHAFRTLWRFLSHLVVPALCTLRDLIHRRFTMLEEAHVIVYISDIWCQKTWAKFDVGWLFIRDACQQRILDHEEGLFEHRQHLWQLCRKSKDYPLYDITQNFGKAVQGVTSSKHMESFLFATYHCIKEVSKPIFRPEPLDRAFWDQPPDTLNSIFWSQPPDYVIKRNGKRSSDNWSATRRNRPSIDHLNATRRNQYFCRLLSANTAHRYLSDLLVIPGFAPDDYLRRVLHDEQMFIFLNVSLRNHPSSALSEHRLELKMRMLWALFSKNHEAINWSALPLLPHVFDDLYPLWYADQGVNNAVTIMDVLAAFFAFIAFEDTKKEVLMHSLHSNPGIPKMLSKIAYFSIDGFANPPLAWKEGVYGKNYRYTSGQYASLFKLIAKHLNKHRSQSKSSINTPSLLFYLASFFVRPFAISKRWDWHSNNPTLLQSFKTLLGVMRSYEQWTAGSVFVELEERFKGYDWHADCTRFSEQWWAFLKIDTWENSLSTDSNGSSSSTT